LSDRAYHDRPEISRSMLMDFRRSRRLYQGRYVTRTIEREVETNAMRIGTVSHVSVLQPERFHELVAVIPSSVLSANGSRAGKAWTEWSLAQEQLGKTTIKAAELSDILAMADAVRERVGWIDRPGSIKEQPIVWRDSESGLDLRALPDFVLPMSGSVLTCDVKTTADIAKFPYQVRDSYWMQDAHYCSGLAHEYGIDSRFTFAAVEKSAPYLCRVYEMSDSMRDQAHAKWRETLQALAECYQSGDWSDPGEDDVQEISLQIY
jgi:hypothetical protein